MNPTPARHLALPSFWRAYNALPAEVRSVADRCYDLLRTDPRHPSLQLKHIGTLWSVRVGLHYRALGLDKPEGIVWFWIGSHAQYDKIISRR